MSRLSPWYFLAHNIAISNDLELGHIVWNYNYIITLTLPPWRTGNDGTNFPSCFNLKLHILHQACTLNHLWVKLKPKYFIQRCNEISSCLEEKLYWEINSTGDKWSGKKLPGDKLSGR